MEVDMKKKRHTLEQQRRDVTDILRCRRKEDRKPTPTNDTSLRERLQQEMNQRQKQSAGRRKVIQGQQQMKTQRRRQQAAESMSNNMARMEQETQQHGRQKLRAQDHALESAEERRAELLAGRQKALRKTREYRRRKCTWTNTSEIEEQQPLHAKPTAAAKMRSAKNLETTAATRSHIEATRTTRQERAEKLAAAARLWRRITAGIEEVPAVCEGASLSDFSRAVGWLDAGFDVSDAWNYGAVMKEAVTSTMQGSAEPDSQQHQPEGTAVRRATNAGQPPGVGDQAAGGQRRAKTQGLSVAERIQRQLQGSYCA
jgi:hypothetical protein